MENIGCKLRIWWIPNNVSSFYCRVHNMAEAYYTLKVLSALDSSVGGGAIHKEIRTDFPEFSRLGENATSHYRAFRKRNSGIGARWASNIKGGVETLENGSDDNWVDSQSFQTFFDYVSLLKDESSKSWKEVLLNAHCVYCV